ncbi:MAG: hypothetical protein E7352_02570 [Clostridiales bacterium]|nr:hypothetical protein [Clostridiales bacterium]
MRSEISRLEQELEESGDEPGLEDTLIESLRSEISRLEQELAGYGDEPGLKDTLEYLRTEEALQKMYQELLELEGKK